MTPSPRAASAASTPRGNRLNHGDRRNSTATVDERRYQKQRTQRATYACERCRIKKLRCTGGHPCSSCRRAEIECDFGDRGLDWQQSASVTNQRLLQLEKTVMDLVSGLSHLTHPQQPALPPSPLPLAGQIASVTSANLADPFRHAPVSGRAINVTGVDSPSSLIARTIGPPDSTFPARSNVDRPTQSQGTSRTPGSIYTSPVHSGDSEGLDSRWAALQNNSAPFPPLMSHPTVWSGGPAKPSPGGDQNAQFALGITRYEAKVDLQSEPVSGGIVDELMARALFTL
jgi:hypothetical protein